MYHYLIRRILLLIPTLLGISLACFLVMQVLPGGPVEQVMAKMKSAAAAHSGSEKVLSPAAIAKLNAYFGFDKPIHERYFSWLGKALRGDLGQSWTYGEPVLKVIFERMPISLFFGLSSFVLTWLICLPLGLWKARRHGSWGDIFSSIAIFGGYVVPGYALGILLILFFAGDHFLNLFPMGGMVSDDFEELNWWEGTLDFLHHMMLPLFCYMISEFAFLTFLIKNSLLEEMRKDYVRSVRARGMSQSRALWVHALRGIMVPLSNRFGEVFTLMFAGALLLEKVFDINGMGLLFYNSMQSRDYPVAMGIIMLSSLMALIGRIFADLAMAALDPRIQLGEDQA